MKEALKLVKIFVFSKKRIYLCLAMKSLKHNETSVVNISYHLIWCPKYRRKILVDGVDDRLKELLSEFAKEIGCKVETIEVMCDHIHIFLRGTPLIAISSIVKTLKGKTSRTLRREFPKLKRFPNLWSRSYYCETIGCINEETIKKYIENQKLKC